MPFITLDLGYHQLVLDTYRLNSTNPMERTAYFLQKKQLLMKAIGKMYCDPWTENDALWVSDCDSQQSEAFIELARVQRKERRLYKEKLDISDRKERELDECHFVEIYKAGKCGLGCMPRYNF